MTVQVVYVADGKNKAALLTSLEDGTAMFYDPSIFETSRGYFGCRDIKCGEIFPVVMDEKRTRFSEVERRKDGTWRVK